MITSNLDYGSNITLTCLLSRDILVRWIPVDPLTWIFVELVLWFLCFPASASCSSQHVPLTHCVFVPQRGEAPLKNCNVISKIQLGIDAL